METKKEEKIVEETTEVKEVVSDVSKSVSDVSDKRERGRKFMFQRNKYYETHDKDGNETSEISDFTWKIKVLNDIFNNKKLKNAEYIMLIFHDKDVKDVETGELKTLHCHCVLEYVNPQYCENVRNYVKAQERNFEKIKYDSAAIRYLTHTTDDAMKDKKVRYNVSEIFLKKRYNDNFIVGDELEKFYRLKICSRAKAKGEIKSIIKADITQKATEKIRKNELKDLVEVQEFVEECGFTFSDYSKNLNTFKNAFEYKKAKIKKEMKSKDRSDLRLIYVQGKSEVGKTKLAKMLARFLNMSVNVDEDSIFNTSAIGKDTTYDFIQDYNLEKSTIFDEQNFKDLGYEQFKQMFDKNNLATISSRFTNKDFFSDFNFIIKSEEIEKQIEKICKKEVEIVKKDFNLTEKEKVSEIENIYKQIKRRIDLIVEVKVDKIDLFVYDKKKDYKEKILLKSYNFGFKEINNLREDKGNEIYKKHFNEINNELFTQDVLNFLGLKKKENQNEEEKNE